MRRDWHTAPIDRATPVDAGTRCTQNVRRFFRAECGPDCKFNRAFMAYMKDGTPKTMGEAADEWLRRQG
jgi:hypothetical protein